MDVTAWCCALGCCEAADDYDSEEDRASSR